MIFQKRNPKQLQLKKTDVPSGYDGLAEPHAAYTCFA
jgi:hypothetical protein